MDVNKLYIISSVIMAIAGIVVLFFLAASAMLIASGLAADIYRLRNNMSGNQR
ncbi:hypothetical protein FRC0292_00292 [Corynebacterium diphtheriae]|nr:hypothetical protein FRC0292_00292 [Corynebacterium diphtheriae]